jgi:hypothetical protein
MLDLLIVCFLSISTMQLPSHFFTVATFLILIDWHESKVA